MGEADSNFDPMVGYVVEQRKKPRQTLESEQMKEEFAAGDFYIEAVSDRDGLALKGLTFRLENGKVISVVSKTGDPTPRQDIVEENHLELFAGEAAAVNNFLNNISPGVISIEPAHKGEAEEGDIDPPIDRNGTFSLNIGVLNQALVDKRLEIEDRTQRGYRHFVLKAYNSA
jgi:hypothetical protein